MSIRSNGYLETSWYLFGLWHFSCRLDTILRHLEEAAFSVSNEAIRTREPFSFAKIARQDWFIQAMISPVSTKIVIDGEGL